MIAINYNKTISLNNIEFKNLYIHKGDKINLFYNKNKIFLIFILHGKVQINNVFFNSRDIFYTKGNTNEIQGVEDTRMILVETSSLMKIKNNICKIDQVLLDYYSKYKSEISELLYNKKPIINNWSSYYVKYSNINPNIELHNHDHTNNLIFILGDSFEVVGMCLVKSIDECYGVDIIPGDMIFVSNEVLHNIIPTNSEIPLEFIVLNDTVSNYDQVEESDYHINEKVSRKSIYRIKSENSMNKQIIISKKTIIKL